MEQSNIDTKLTLPVVGEICMSSKYYYIVKFNNGNDYYVPQFKFQRNIPLPANCICTIKKNFSGVPTLEQDRYTVIKSLYEENKIYPFRIISRLIDPNTKQYYLMLTDNYLFSSRLYLSDQDLNSGIDFSPDKEINCIVKRIDPRGFPILGFVSDVNTLKVFVSAERLFKEIGFPDDTDQYFYKMRPLVEQDCYANKQFRTLFTEYEKHENLWCFSYLNFLEKHIDHITAQHPNKPYDVLTKLVSLFKRIELWLIRDSNFLTNFSLEKRKEIRQVAEFNLAKMQRLSIAIGLVRYDKVHLYIQKQLAIAERSSFLSNASQHLLILSKTFILESKHLIHNRKRMIRLMDILYKEDEPTNNVILFIINLLETFQSILDKKRKHPQINLLLTACLVLCYQKTDKWQLLASKKSRFLRELGAMDKKINLRRSIECLLNQPQLSPTPDFHWSDLGTSYFHKLPFFTSSGNKQESCSYKILPYINGQIVLDAKRFTFYLQKDSMFGLPWIYISSQNTSISLLQGSLVFILPSTHELKNLRLSKQNNIWMKKAEQASAKNRYMQVKVKQTTTKAIITTQTGSAKTGRISMINFFKWYIPNLAFEKIVHPGDSFIAELISDQEATDELSIRGLIWNIAQNIYHPGNTTKALFLLKGSNNIHYWITQDGFSAYSCETPDKPLIPNTCYKVMIKDLPKSEQALFIEVVQLLPSEQFDPNEAIRNLINKYLATPETQEEAKLGAYIEYKPIFKELLQIIDTEIGTEKNIQERFNLLQAGIQIASIIKNYTYYSYYLSEINFMINLDNFNNSPDEFSHVYTILPSNLLIDHPETMRKQQMYNLLSYYKSKNTATTDILYDVITDKNDKRIQQLAELILTANLLYKNNFPQNVQNIVKDKIIALLNDNPDASLSLQPATEPKQKPAATVEQPQKQIIKEKHTEPANFGLESTTKEFKTSIVYPAGQKEADMPQQMNIIMRTISAFLNSKGGSLLIGIQNNGQIRGIQGDLFYLNGDEDLYERIIRQNIVESFSKEINSLIEFKFHKYSTGTVCEIQIPPYEEPIIYKKKLWQRQGNECRIIKSSDIEDYMNRRFPNRKTVIHENDLQETILFYLAYSNQTFFLTDEQPAPGQNPDEQIVIPVYDYQKDGFVLIGYDNGRISKMPVQLLSKQEQRTESIAQVNSPHKLLFIAIIPRHLLLAVTSRDENATYVKIMDTASIPAQIRLTRKGTFVVGAGKHQLVDVKLVDYCYHKQLIDLCYLSCKPAGVKITDPQYENTLKLLKSIKLAVDIFFPK